MNKKQKEETFNIFSGAFHEVVIPELQEIKEKLTSIDDRVISVENRVDSLNRKFDAQQTIEAPSL